MLCPVLSSIDLNIHTVYKIEYEDFLKNVYFIFVTYILEAA